MKKRVFAFLMVACMVVSNLPMPAHAEEAAYYCGKEVHTHADSCYSTVLHCEEVEHKHGETCYESTQTLACTLPEAHDHGEGCFDAEGNVTCTKPLAHVHSEACTKEADAYTCGYAEAHAHGEACYTASQNLICEIPEHAHDAVLCYTAETVETTCTLEEHSHAEACLADPNADASAPEAEPQAEPPVCTCETACTAEAMKADCAICGAEGAAVEGCGKYAAPQVKTVTAWEWHDEYEMITDGSIGLIWDELAWTDLAPMLPGITAVIDDETETLALTWNCADIADGFLYAGTHTLTAALPEGYALGEEAAELALTLEMGGGEVFETETVTYLDASGNTQNVPDGYTSVTATTTTWNAGWYVVDGTVEINNIVELSGNVHLVLKDGCSLTITKGINDYSYSSALTIYGQSGNTGVINVTASGTYAIYALGGITINGGRVNATANALASTANVYGIYSDSISINGGIVNLSVTATGEYATACGIACRSNSVSINGGTVNITATNTNGKAHGIFYVGNPFSDDEIRITGGTTTVKVTGKGANNALAFSDTPTITGGTVDTFVSTDGGATYSREYGGFQVTGSPAGLGGVSYANGVLTVGTTEAITISNKGSLNNAVSDRIVINADGAKVTLYRVGIRLGANGESTDTAPITINNTCALTLISQNHLYWNGNSLGGAGIRITGGTTTINGNGSLEKFTNYQNSIWAADSSTLIIACTGTTSPFFGNVPKITCGSLTVSGGKVTAANISASGDITISGGSVSAENGSITSSKTVTISGGYVKAQSITGQFSTGENGNAVIETGSIDESDKENWKGVIFVGDSGKVYGNVMLRDNVHISSTGTLMIPANSSLDLGGYTMNYSGTLIVDGGLKNTGEYGYLNGTNPSYYYIPDTITVADLYYTGSALNPTVTYPTEEKTILEKTFKPYTDWGAATYTHSDGTAIGGNEIVDLGTYKAKVSKFGIDREAEFHVLQSGTTFDGGVKTYNGDRQTSTFTYGDTITVKVTPQATGEAPNLAQRLLRAFVAAPDANQMAIFKGDTQLTDPQTVTNGQEVTFTLTGLRAERHTLTAKYVGNDAMANHSQTFSVTVNPKPLTVTQAPVASSSNLVYIGEAQNLVTAGASSAGGVMQYSLTNNGMDWDRKIPTGTNAGTYTVYYRAAPTTSDYTHSEKGFVEVRIAQAQNSWKTYPTITGWTYGETPNDPTAEAEFGDVTFSYIKEGTDLADATPPTAAGRHQLIASVAATDNYESLQYPVGFNINKATPTADLFTFTAPDPGYNGQAKAAEVTPKANVTGVGNITVRYFKDGEPLSGPPTALGTYTVKIDVAAGDNYLAATGISDATWTFTITKGTYTVPLAMEIPILRGGVRTGTVTLADLFGGNPLLSGAKIESITSNDDIELMDSVTNKGNAFTYTSRSLTDTDQTIDIYKLTISSRDYLDFDVTVSFIPTDKQSVRITGITADTSLVYNGKAQAGFTGTPTAAGYSGPFTYSYQGSAGTSYGPASQPPVNAGDYVVTICVPEEDPTYTGTVSMNFSIGKKPLEWDVSKLSATKYVGVEGDVQAAGTLGVTGLLPGEENLVTITGPFVTSGFGPITEKGEYPVEITILGSGVPTLANYEGPKGKPSIKASVILRSYRFTSGQGQTVSRGDNADFTADMPYDRFQAVYVDNVYVAPGNYASGSGSTKLTLYGSYLQTLSSGTHVLTLTASDGQATTTFSIRGAGSGRYDSDAPATGDTTQTGLWLALAALGLIGLTGSIAAKKHYRKRR